MSDNTSKWNRIVPILVSVTGICILMAAIASASPDILPGSGDPRGILEMIHPNVRNNTEITTFLDTCGLATWSEGHKNSTYKYVYLVPAGQCREKLVFLNRNADERADPATIRWARLIGLDATLDPDPSDPLEGFFAQFPEARNDPAVAAIIRNYRPGWWHEDTTAGGMREACLVSDGEIFRELIVWFDNGTVIKTITVDDSDLMVNATDALAVAGIDTTARSPGTIYIRAGDGTLAWVIVSQEGPAFRMITVDSGGFGRHLSGAPENGKHVPGFTAATAGLLLVIFLAVRICKKDPE